MSLFINELERSDLEVVKLGDEVNVCVAQKGYQGGEIYLDHDEDDPTTARYFRKLRKKAKFQRRFLDDVYGLIDGVRYGLGKAILPYHLIKNEKNIEIIDKKNLLYFPVILHFYSQTVQTRLHTEVVAALQKKAPQLLHCDLKK